METSRRAARRNGSEIKDQVPNLPEEDICSSKLETICTILIAIYDPKSTEVWSRLQHRHVVRIADDLRVIVIDNRRTDDVCPGGEVYNGWSRG